MLTPQTIAGTVASIPSSSCTSWCQYTITMPSASWVAILTGQTTVNVLVPPSGWQDISSTSTLAVGSSARFNGYLFNNSGTLTLVALVKGPAPGTAIAQH